MSLLLIPILAVFVNLTVQIATFRHWRGTRYFASIVSGFSAGLVALAGMEAMYLWENTNTEASLVAFLVNVPIYVALAYCYYSFVQLGQTSIRIRLYAEISSQPQGLLTEEVYREYSDQTLVQVRLQRLIESGDVIFRDGSYSVGRSRFVFVGNLLFKAKSFLLGKHSEFDNVF
jgi:hypothetical protein